MKFINHIRGTVIISMALLPCLLQAQGLRIGRGASVVVQGNASLVLNDAAFINDGQFSAGSGTVLFTGGELKSNAFIGGISRTAFSNVQLNRAYSKAQLESDVSITGSLVMSAGDLELNNHRIDLGSSGMIMGEHLNARITGTKGGIVTATAILNAPQNVNPGNIGIELSSAANLGITVITRGHVQQTSAGRQGIQRYYDIEPAFNASDIALRFHYLEPELGGNNEAELVLWSGNRTSFNWTAVGKENGDVATNWIAKNNISGMNRFTLGIAEKGLPANSAAKGLGDARAGISFMQTYPNPARDRFTVAVYSDGDKQGTVSLQDARGQVLERRQVRYVKGMNTMQWNISGYAAGTYYLVLENTGARNVEVVKQ